MDISSLEVRTQSLAKQFDKLSASISNLQTLIDCKNYELIQQKEDILVLQKTMELFKALVEEEAEKSKNMFLTIINYGLNAIFGERIKFDLELKQYATGSFYFPVLIKDGVKEAVFSSGGGLLDIISFLCRIVVLVAFYKEDERVLKLDEPFRNLSEEYRDKTALLLKHLSDRFKIQFIIVTHMEFLKELEGATVYRTDQVDGITTYKKL